jgi:N6-adenosine-specific RNA methylase IME4
MKYHPLANICPLMEGAAFDALVADIKANGLRDPLVMHEGLLLDGRNRWRAAETACITITGNEIKQFDPKKDGDPLAWIISKNVHRRQLNESQRAMVAANLANMRQGERTDLPSIEGKSISQTDAAMLLNVSHASVERAKTVQRDAVLEIVKAVEQGQLAVSLGACAAKMSAEDQAEVAARAARGEINVVRKVIKQKIRKEKELRLGAKQIALPQKKYGVILADPEWKFKTYSEEGKLGTSAEMHYPTSELEVIKARDVASISADDCVLFLWGTVPMTPQALEVMAAWGFRYVTNFAWVKDHPGTGYWNRNQHETLFIGTKGKPPAPAPGTQWSSVIFAPVGEHSEKPERVLEMIEAYFPTLPKIELNRRGAARAGWDAWGNEVEPEVAA